MLSRQHLWSEALRQPCLFLPPLQLRIMAPLPTAASLNQCETPLIFTDPQCFHRSLSLSFQLLCFSAPLLSFHVHFDQYVSLSFLGPFGTGPVETLWVVGRDNSAYWARCLMFILSVSFCLLVCVFYFCFKILFFSKIITLLFLSLAVMNLITIEKAPQFFFLPVFLFLIIVLFFSRLSAGGGWEMQFSRWHAYLAYLAYLSPGIEPRDPINWICAACPSFEQWWKRGRCIRSSRSFCAAQRIRS